MIRILLRALAVLLAALAAFVLIAAPDTPIRRASTKLRAARDGARRMPTAEPGRRVPTVNEWRASFGLEPVADGDAIASTRGAWAAVADQPIVNSYDALLRGDIPYSRDAGVWPYPPIEPEARS